MIVRGYGHCSSNPSMEKVHMPGESVLVVDGDDSVRECCRRMLEWFGYRVVAAGTVEEALGGLNGHAFDAVVCDYPMRGQTGLDFLRILRDIGRPEADRFLFMIRFSPERVDLGVPVLYKPFDLVEFKEAIESVIKRNTESLP